MGKIEGKDLQKYFFGNVGVYVRFWTLLLKDGIVGIISTVASMKQSFDKQQMPW